MKNFLRKLAVRGGIVVLVLVVLLVLVPRLIPTEVITHQIVSAVARATGAEVTLGEARIAWRGGWRVDLREGTLKGTGAALAAATGSSNDLESYHIEIEELSVVPALLPLLRKQVEVKAISLKGQELRVRWDKGEAAVANYRITLTDLDLGLAKMPPTGSALPPGERIPADLVFNFAVTADTLVMQEAPYTDVEVEGRFGQKVLEVTDFDARRSTGTLEGKLSVDFTDNPWGTLVFEAEAEDVPAVALLEPWAPGVGNRLDCDLKTKLEGSCDVRDKATALKTLNVEGWMGGDQGVLHAGDWLADVSSYLGDRQDLKDVAFEGLIHKFGFTQGRYLIKKTTLSGGETDWSATGWVDLEGNLAVGVDVILPPGFTPDLGNFSFLANSLRDEKGRINLPLILSGRSARPDVGVDLGRLRSQ